MTLQWVDYPLFEYERTLGAREIEKLEAASRVTPDLNFNELLLLRATFLRTVDDVDGNPLVTMQSRVEASHRELRRRTSNRQSTRFLVHGLHEYKGKFNPQMARSLINVVDPTATSLIDPFCGSGTSLIEGLRLGMDVGGVDLNPLAAWMTRVKVSVLRRSGDPALPQLFERASQTMVQKMAAAQKRGTARTPRWVDSQDDEYLRRWFPEPVLAAMWVALEFARHEADDVTADVVRLTISNIVRSVSWQLPEDLRVRRRPDDWTPPEVADVFQKAATLSLTALREVAAAPEIDEQLSATVMEGSSKELATLQSVAAPGRRMVLTSPPYATALPYIDTDRLSLVLLGLTPAAEIRGLERELTGSREWTRGMQQRWDAVRLENRRGMPQEVTALVEEIAARNDSEGAGFRRAAVPSLLYRYFADMGDTLAGLGTVLRPSERATLVVGSNRTGRGASAIAIPTPELIGAVAETRGFFLDEVIALETWPRYGMHAGNAVNAESAVVLTRR